MSKDELINEINQMLTNCDRITLQAVRNALARLGRRRSGNKFLFKM